MRNSGPSGYQWEVYTDAGALSSLSDPLLGFYQMACDFQGCDLFIDHWIHGAPVVALPLRAFVWRIAIYSVRRYEGNNNGIDGHLLDLYESEAEEKKDEKK
ncbi:hypothetical protein EYC80_000351 [Monilinia laxa]|uniref:Uncharacterized protein n=1 Tax=Monilinia laxa TaxID=61186 RepID=A0A5N6KAH0_MONLA|nr:hypothetical protein EYC80_000351 [Monilinia laxa]